MHIRIEPNSGIPLGTQITRGIRLAIAQGQVQPGEQLPSARDLAAQLRVNFHTVRKAFGELEADGVLELRRGRGTFVPENPKALPVADLEQIVRGHVERMVEDLAGTDVDESALSALIAAEVARALRRSEEE